MEDRLGLSSMSLLRLRSHITGATPRPDTGSVTAIDRYLRDLES